MAGIYFWLWVFLCPQNDYFTFLQLLSVVSSFLRLFQTHRRRKKIYCHKTQIHLSIACLPRSTLLTQRFFFKSLDSVAHFRMPVKLRSKRFIYGDVMWFMYANFDLVFIYLYFHLAIFVFVFFICIIIIYEFCDLNATMMMSKQYNHRTWFHYRTNETKIAATTRILLSFVSKGIQLIDAWAHFFFI